MSPSFIRTFHPIGQGAFYTEQHREGNQTLTIVYDCGSLTAPKEHFLRKVATALPRGTVIDLLFISHFHADHINGLDELKRKYTIRAVVLPKLTEEARVLVKLENFLEYEGFSSVLIDNPRAYFGRRTRIIFVEPIDPNAGTAAEIILNNDRFVEVPGEQDQDLRDSAAPAGKQPGRLRTITSGTPLRLTLHKTAFWEYVPYNYEYAARRTTFVAMLKKLKIELGTLGNLEQVINRKKDLSKAYRSLDGDLNENSLVVYSGALTDPMRLLHRGHSCTCWHPFYASVEKEGCLYLGDLDLNIPTLPADLQTRLGSRWDRIQTLQVPHHGSVHNFVPLPLDKDVQAIISYGSNNTYGHPSAHVIGQLHLLQATPILVTEQLDTAFYLHT
ncbi:MBL fold metallo-hydrolase [Hymenobacter volaticus]|uniref:MBL fold metallo-hydrolase n=1 Tax=Hymenobacter volaticus TaxID=2932254 RepID=A0ABY4GEW9_9BACT|nr:MBL fold metallo-hydrolase [Hymenobacter volaticus]UOQ69475.1 MBL fold metallo-hydrolase [Hymenobacter volaticus]